MTGAVSPRSLPEALDALAAEPRRVPMAGCTDLLVREPLARLALGDGPGVLDLLGVPELRGVAERDGGLEIGATTTFSQLRDHPAVGRLFPALAAAAAEVGGWQIQNRATLGGNVANASPAGDSLPVLLALEATVVAVGPGGRREIPYRDFHTGYRTTALAPGELLGWVRLPAPAPGTVQVWRKVGTRRAQAISKVSVALAGRVEDGRIAGLRLAAGSVAAVPLRLTAVEEALEGEPATPATADRSGDLAAAAVEPIDDVRSTADYRRWALGRVVRRAVLALVAASAG